MKRQRLSTSLQEKGSEAARLLAEGAEAVAGAEAGIVAAAERYTPVQCTVLRQPVHQHLPTKMPAISAYTGLSVTQH